MIRDMQLIDSHCHLDDEHFDADRGAVIERAVAAGIDTFVVPAVTATGWPKLRELAESYACIHPAYGLHPWFCKRHQPEELILLEQYLEQASTSTSLYCRYQRYRSASQQGIVCR